MNENIAPHSSFVPPSDQDHRQGSLSATVVLVMYGDYQCVLSVDVYRLINVIQQQLRESIGENYLCVIFRHFPQDQLHPHAWHAAEAAESAAAQGQFWQMHNTLFTHQELENGYLVEYANNLGLDMSQFLQDLSKRAYIEQIQEDIESGIRSGVTSAPALFINGIRYSDRWALEPLKTAILTADHDEA